MQMGCFGTNRTVNPKMFRKRRTSVWHKLLMKFTSVNEYTSVLQPLCTTVMWVTLKLKIQFDLYTVPVITGVIAIGATLIHRIQSHIYFHRSTKGKVWMQEQCSKRRLSLKQVKFIYLFFWVVFLVNMVSMLTDVKYSNTPGIFGEKGDEAANKFASFQNDLILLDFLGSLSSHTVKGLLGNFPPIQMAILLVPAGLNLWRCHNILYLSALQNVSLVWQTPLIKIKHYKISKSSHLGSNKLRVI